MDKLMKYFPVALAVFAIITAGVTAQLQIKGHTDSIKELKEFVTATNPKLVQITLNEKEIADLNESVDENEEWLGELQWQVNELN